MYTWQEITKEESWHPEKIKPDFPFTQSFLYGVWQEQMGRKVVRLLGLKDEKEIVYLSFVEYPLIKGKTYLYSPYGPVIDKDQMTDDFFKELHKKIKNLIEKEKNVFARIDPVVTGEVMEDKYSGIFRVVGKNISHGSYIQPRTEWRINIEKSEEDILKGMHEKTRYSIKYAEKKGVATEIIKNDFSNYFEYFLKLMRTTSSRNKFSLHDEKYYRYVFESIKGREDVFLSKASFEGELLVMNLIVIHGNQALYVFGGSSNTNRNLCGPHALKWAEIKELKSRSVKWFNLGAIDGEGENHFGGLTEFKTRFSGEKVLHGKFFDVIADTFWYYLYTFRKILLNIFGK